MGLNMYDWINAGLGLLQVVAALVQVAVGNQANKVRVNQTNQEVKYMRRERR